MRTLALLSLMSLVVVAGSFPCAKAAPVPKHLMPEAANPDLAALQGKWELTSANFDGNLIRGQDLGYTLEFQGNKAIFTIEHLKRRVTANAKFDLKAKPPRISFADQVTTDFDGKAVNDPGTRMNPQIYKIEDGAFIMASFVEAQGQNAPKTPPDFSGKHESRILTKTFKKTSK